jgi:hypothetical protein
MVVWECAYRLHLGHVTMVNGVSKRGQVDVLEAKHFALRAYDQELVHLCSSSCQHRASGKHGSKLTACPGLAEG